MFVNNHTCALVLLFGTNYITVHTNAGITVKCLLSDVWYFTFFFNLFFPGVKLPVFGYWTFVWIIDFYSSWVDKVKDRILYNKVWKDNWTYWDTCQYYIIYGSIGAIWVHFKRNYNLFDQVLTLLLLYCFLFIWIDRNYFLF